MTLQLADRTFREPKGILPDVPVTVDKFSYPVDFVVLEMEDNSESIILGCPFLAITGALIDVQGANLTLRLGSEQVTFNMSNALGLPEISDKPESVNSVSHCVREVHAPIPDTSINMKAIERQQQDKVQCHYAVYQIADDKERNYKNEEKGNPQKEELKPLPAHLKHSFLGNDKQFPVIISSKLDEQQEAELIDLLRKYRVVIGYSILDMKVVNSNICTHRIYLEEGSIPSREHQRRLNPHLQEVVKREILKLLDAGIIYPISDSEWVSPIHMVPKKGGFTVEENEKGEKVSTRPVTSWRMTTDFRKLNHATRKDHFPLAFVDQMLERLAGHKYFCYLDGYSGFLQIPIHPQD